MNLQHQIRQKLVDGIINGAFPPGMKLPSSRKLSQQLDVARNTVVAAYQQLIADGYLVSRQRSGIFVNEKMLESRVGAASKASVAGRAVAAPWILQDYAKRLPGEGSDQLPNWSRYPFPFIDGKFDSTLFPLAEWREASRLSLSVADVVEWSMGSGDADDPMLLNEIRTKILTRRGIQARPDQILITMGTQNSLFLISQLVADDRTTAAIEEPGNFVMRNLLRRRGAAILPQATDDSGLVVSESLADADIVYVTPSHQVPTAVTMPLERRQALMEAAHTGNFVIIEDDYECETSYTDYPLPALRSMDNDGRVIYVASFSNVLAPGVRLGFIVANSAFIERARRLRHNILDHPPLNNQRTAAIFLSLGHYDALMLRLGRVLRERRTALRRALNNVRGIPMEISPEVGGTTYWVRTPDDFDVGNLSVEAERHGVLIEPVSRYYANKEHAENCFRMGVTSLVVDKIRPGVERLVELIREIVKGHVEHLSTSSGNWLTGGALTDAMSGATLLYREVNGWPCTIVYHPDGLMTGQRGFANEDHDSGRWRVDGDRFLRRWDRWVYGEEKAYFIVIDGDKIKFFNDDRQIVDSAFVRLADRTVVTEPLQARKLDP
ncbi:MAG: PLP-dependent aminotransferase family protein [Gammaproteobacteria bacterium]|nr:PLP-dependent aminotransferase family protein [Gammaproteobacteria bacterium]MDH5582601.1 PLP-dependent aminotransferase family protein [Gammaproteobacteria bacterium]